MKKPKKINTNLQSLVRHLPLFPNRYLNIERTPCHCLRMQTTSQLALLQFSLHNPITSQWEQLKLKTIVSARPSGARIQRTLLSFQP